MHLCILHVELKTLYLKTKVKKRTRLELDRALNTLILHAKGILLHYSGQSSRHSLSPPKYIRFTSLVRDLSLLQVGRNVIERMFEVCRSQKETAGPVTDRLRSPNVHYVRLHLVLPWASIIQVSAWLTSTWAEKKDVGINASSRSQSWFIKVVFAREASHESYISPRARPIERERGRGGKRGYVYIEIKARISFSPQPR